LTPSASRPRSWRQFILGLVLYVVAIVLQNLFLAPEQLQTGGLPSVLVVLLAVLPMAPAVWAMLGWVEAVRGFDEMQRKMLSEAGLLSLGFAGISTFSYGFLETFLGLPRLSMFVVWPLISFSFLLAYPMVRRRYR